MTRLIDADGLKNKFWHGDLVPHKEMYHISEIRYAIDNAPTVELFCSYLSDGEIRQPCVESPCNHERTQGEWISVYERLPEEEGDYLLWGNIDENEDDEYSFIGRYDEECEQFGIWQEQFDSRTLGSLGSEFYAYSKVIAWQPLPKPYKREADNDKRRSN